MTALDAVLMAFYFLLFATSKSRDSLVVLAAFSASVLYTSSNYWNILPQAANHLIVSMCFIPAAWFLRKRTTIAIFLCILHHWVTSLDYILYINTNTVISESFTFVSLFINMLIMFTLFDGKKHGKSIAITGMGGGWLPNLLHGVFNSKKVDQ